MNTRVTVGMDGGTIRVHIPMTFRKRGGRKLVVTPDGAEWAPRPRVDNAMVKALARAFRWPKMLDQGVHATIEDLARAKGVHATCTSRALRLTLLAPEIIEAILDGRQPATLHLDGLLDWFPLEWEGQRRAYRRIATSFVRHVMRRSPHRGPVLGGTRLTDISTTRNLMTKRRTAPSAADDREPGSHANVVARISAIR